MDEVGSFFFRSDIWSQLSWGSMVRVANYRKSSKRGRDHMSVVFQEASQLNALGYKLISILISGDSRGSAPISSVVMGSKMQPRMTNRDDITASGTKVGRQL